MGLGPGFVQRRQFKENASVYRFAAFVSLYLGGTELVRIKLQRKKKISTIPVPNYIPNETTLGARGFFLPLFAAKIERRSRDRGERSFFAANDREKKTLWHPG